MAPRYCSVELQGAGRDQAWPYRRTSRRTCNVGALCLLVGLVCMWTASSSAQAPAPRSERPPAQPERPPAQSERLNNIAVVNSVVLLTTLLIGVAGFFRNIEQNKDGSFREISSRLCEKDSPVIRAAAACQLPEYFHYRRYYVLRRPYPSQVLYLLLHSLKKEHDLDVRQALFNSLVAITGTAPLKTVAQSVGTDLGKGIDFVRANLDEVIMDDFNFSGIDLTEASMRKSSLIRAQFAGANLWKATIIQSKAEEANFTNSSLWDARLEHSNFQKAQFLTDKVDNLSLAGSDLRGAVWSERIDPRRMGAYLGD